jgi:hypothetical protein
MTQVMTPDEKQLSALAQSQRQGENIQQPQAYLVNLSEGTSALL